MSTTGLGVITAVRIFIPFALGFYFSYCVRNVNAVIAPDLVAELSLDASALGLLTSAYFVTFAAFQLPLGVLLDRYGPRRVEAVLLLLAGVGCLLFSASDSLSGLVAARALIGLGASACLMGALKANTLWFSTDRLPLANGCILTAGGLGALSATAPVEAMLAFTDWRGVFVAFAAFAVAAGVALLAIVPARPEEARGSDTEPLRDQFKDMLRVLSSTRFWRVLPAATTSQAAFLSMQGLWAGPWLADVAGLDRSAVAEHLFVIAVAMTAGFLTLGAFAARMIRRGASPLGVAALCIGLLALPQVGLVLDLPLPPLLMWGMFAFFGGSGLLLYSALTPQFPPQQAGRVVTSLNLFAFGGAFAAQWGMGAVLDLFPAERDGSFTLAGYQWAFGIMLLLQLAALLWIGARRSSHPP
jgi:sugar phosphate permease